MAVDIIPALLVNSPKDLTDGLALLRGIAPWVQVDFVPRNYMEGQESFPLWQEFDFEADLMTTHPLGDAQSVVALGAGRVVIHAQNAQAKEALEFLQQYRQGEYKVEVGVALRAHDTPDMLKNFDGLYDYVQVMGIAHEGAQGQPPDPQAVGLVKALRAAYPNLLIQVDGAAAPRAAELAAAGASRLVVGSALVTAADPKAAYKSLYNEANGSD